MVRFMNLKLKTSSEVEKLLIELQVSLQFSTKAAVMRLAIALSLQEKGDPREMNGEIIKYDLKNQDGAEYYRFTIMGSDDYLYKILFEEHMQIHLSEEDFFPECVNAHIERGIRILNSEIRYAKNRDNFFKTIFKIK